VRGAFKTLTECKGFIGFVEFCSELRKTHLPGVGADYGRCIRCGRGWLSAPRPPLNKINSLSVSRHENLVSSRLSQLSPQKARSTLSASRQQSRQFFGLKQTRSPSALQERRADRGVVNSRVRRRSNERRDEASDGPQVRFWPISDMCRFLSRAQGSKSICRKFFASRSMNVRTLAGKCSRCG